jgi:hypothetical protein
VIATAITPSENDSSRLVPIPGGSPGRRAILVTGAHDQPDTYSQPIQWD